MMNSFVVMKYQGRFISCNKCTTLVRYINNTEGWDFWREKVYGKSPQFPLIFCCKHITSLKKQPFVKQANKYYPGSTELRGGSDICGLFAPRAFVLASYLSLKQVSANFLCKGPGSKYFKLREQCTVCDIFFLLSFFTTL